MAKITRQSRLTFGKHRGRKLSECDKGYLEWMVKNLSEGDFFAWAAAATAEIAARKSGEVQQAKYDDLEKEADRILREAGFKP